MAREVSTIYTGANVSITIGDNLITNAFGISYELSQNKRPVYGYNSTHFDAMASGQVIILGQIYFNYQHPNYLSSVLSDYFANNNKGAISRLADYNHRAEYTKRNAYLRQERNLDDVLNSIFADDYTKAIFEGTLENKQIKDEKDPAFIKNLTVAERSSPSAIYARPDQFTDNTSAVENKINIVITYGDPKLSSPEESGILSYMPSYSVILSGVHFIGEGVQVMADDQPVMETYKFMARDKFTLR